MPWQRRERFSTRGRSMTSGPVTAAAAHGLRGREFCWLTVLDSGSELGKDKPLHRRGRQGPHATPVVVHRNIGRCRPAPFAHGKRKKPQVAARRVPSRRLLGEQVLRQACRMSERGTTGTKNRQH